MPSLLRTSLPSRARLVVLAGLLPMAVGAFTRTGNSYLSDGSVADTQAAIAAASPGDIVRLPAGSFTWGAGTETLFIDKAITLAGAGRANTTINLSPESSVRALVPVIKLFAAATVRDFTVAITTNIAAFETNGPNGWRITNINYYKPPSPPLSGYFCLINNNYGVIDNCTITGGAGNNELIFGRGPADSWQTPSSLGGVNNVFIEDCIFDGPGYVCDANSNARFVVRFCTINGAMKVDGHGVASNSPPRSVRHMEVYGNRWSTSTKASPMIEMRGGSGYVFDNTTINVISGYGWFFLTDYGYTAPWPNFGSRYQTPADWPVKDQIGVGMDPKVGGSEPMYLWNNRAAATDNAGVATVDWALSWKQIPPEAITQYRTETGNPTATYTLQDVIVADRDYFKHTHGAVFDGSTGVGIGTKAQMLAITPAKVGIGFWVTDEGEWNLSQSGPDGQLYTWNGTAWTLKYIPYSYPHPLRRPVAPSQLRLTP